MIIFKGCLNYILIFILILVFLFGFFVIYDIPGLVYAEINTLFWGNEFDDPELFSWEDIPVNSVDAIKVLECTDKYAKVYYVLNNYQTAYVNHYVMEDGKWQHGPYGYLLWDSEHIGGNKEGPRAYGWHYRLRNKYMPMNKKYRTRTPIEADDIIRHPEEPLTQE